MSGLEALRAKWLEERPLYGQLCQSVKSLLEEETRRSGIACAVYARPKEVASLLKKAIRKAYSHPYEEILDKAGVRVVCTYADSLPRLEEIVRQSFTVHKYDNKTLGLEYDQLGYLGIHFEVSLRDGDLDASNKLRGLICEVQLHTRAQNLWADIAHELSYKPSQAPPPKIKRAVYRLVALVELFDQQVAAARSAMLNLDGFQEAHMLEQLDRHFYRFTAKTYDRELSLSTLLGLQGLFSKEEIEGVEPLLDEFVERRAEKLSQIYAQYAEDDRCNPLLFQPETMLVFERLERDPFRLKEAWASLLPLELLESLATVWGSPL